MALSEMPEKPTRHNHKLCETCQDWKDRLRGYEASIKMSHLRSLEAIRHWEKATGNSDIWPDLGELLAWLMRKAGLSFSQTGLGKSPNPRKWERAKLR